jgi:nitroreductase
LTWKSWRPSTKTWTASAWSARPSVYPLVWNILLAARNEGYGGNLTSMAVPQEAQVRQLLGLPDTHALAALVPLGKPTRQLTKLRRQTVEETVTHEHFDGAPFTRPTHHR